MNTKPLLFGLIGFLLGGLVVSIAASNTGMNSYGDMNAAMVNSLKDKKGDDFDKAFLSSMIEHHQAGVDMAALIEANAKHAEVKQLGKNIISVQSKEIDMMQRWQTDWGYKETPQMHHMGSANY